MFRASGLHFHNVVSLTVTLITLWELGFRVWRVWRVGIFRVYQGVPKGLDTVDDINPALPRIGKYTIIPLVYP